MLDDNEHRREVFTAVYGVEGHQVSTVSKFGGCVGALEGDGPWDLLHLDYDLGDYDEADSFVDEFGNTVEFNGGHIVTRIARMPEVLRPARVIIHSVNEDGAIDMMEALGKLGIPTTWEPFGDLLDPCFLQFEEGVPDE